MFQNKGALPNKLLKICFVPFIYPILKEFIVDFILSIIFFKYIIYEKTLDWISIKLRRFLILKYFKIFWLLIWLWIDPKLNIWFFGFCGWSMIFKMKDMIFLSTKMVFKFYLDCHFSKHSLISVKMEK